MTDRIAEIRARLEAATTGPWEWTGGYPQRITNGEALLIAEVYHDPDSIPHETIFIAHAPDDIRYLLDELEELKDRLIADGWSERVGYWEKTSSGGSQVVLGETTRAEAAEAEVERLREAIDKARHELGVPSGDYPAPIANAYDILLAALHADSGEATTSYLDKGPEAVR